MGDANLYRGGHFGRRPGANHAVRATLIKAAMIYLITMDVIAQEERLRTERR
jgi:hypothetical protein